MARKAKIVRSEEIAGPLCALLGLDPRQLIGLVIELRVKDVAKITATFWGTDLHGDVLADVIKEYRLLEAESVTDAD